MKILSLLLTLMLLQTHMLLVFLWNTKGGFWSSLNIHKKGIQKRL